MKGHMSTDFAVCYAITPDVRFRNMAKLSIRSLHKYNPDVPVFIKEQEGGDYPIGIKHSALQAFTNEHNVKWLLLLDADTIITGSLNFLEPPTGTMFCGRHETMWTLRKIRPKAWRKICKAAQRPFVPIFNSGAFLIPASSARQIGDSWATWMDWLRANVEDPLVKREAATRYEWWMLDQYALSLSVALFQRTEWSHVEHSYQWCEEDFGLIHHFGSKRWKDFTDEL